MIESLGKISIIVMGEAENCSFQEKEMIAAVAWNRLISKNLKFNNLEKDFYGYNRIFKISNKLEKNALEDSINSSIRAYEKVKSGLYKNIYFFSLKGHKKPSSFYKLKKINTPTTFKHNFYKIEEKIM